MSERPVLSELSEREREQAFERFQILQPFLEGHTSFSQIAVQSGVKLRTLQRWARNYREHGLAGLAHKRRFDRQMRRMLPELITLIEGLALQKTRPSAAAIHRQVVSIALGKGSKSG